MLLLLSRFSRVRLCATPQTAAHQALLSLGFSRQEHWSGLPLPSPCNRNNHVLSSFSHWSKSLDQILSDPPLCAVSSCFALYHFVPPGNGRWFPTSARVLHSLLLIKPSRASIFQALIKERPSATLFCMTFIESFLQLPTKQHNRWKWKLVIY